MHRKRHFILIGETIDCLVDLLDGVSSVWRIETRVLREIQMIEVFCLIDDGLTSDDLAVIIYENIVHDGENPSFEIHIFIILFSVVQYTKRCFLQQIFCFFSVGSQCQCEIKHIILQT